MLGHLEKRGGTLDFAKTQEVKAERDALWDDVEHLVTYFDHVEQGVKQMERTLITIDTKELLNQTLYMFKQISKPE